VSRSTRTSAPEELARLNERCSQASQRIDELESSWRTANQERAGASAALIEAERRGAERERLEKALSATSSLAGEPWSERVAGARAAAGDVDQERRAFIAENLAELVEERQAAGAAVAESINRHLESLVADYREWHAVEQQISGLAAAAGPVRPGDVTRTKSEELMREVEALRLAGGEEGPRLRNYPPIAEQAAAEAVSA
jgi:hypothetical protein